MSPAEPTADAAEDAEAPRRDAERDPADESAEVSTLYRGTLDRGTLQQLFLDLDALAQLIEVRVKGGAREHAEVARASLQRAHQLWTEQPQISGLQLVYRYEGDVWCDTLLRAPGGATELVRTILPAGGEP